MSARRAELRVRAVLESYPASTIQRAMPVVLLILAHELGVDGLRPRLKRALLELIDELGIDASMDQETIERHAREYALTVGIDDQLLRDLEAVITTMDLGPELERGPRHFALLDRAPPRAAHFEAARPADSESGRAFVLRVTGRLGA